jgi:hypothetical protein
MIQEQGKRRYFCSGLLSWTGLVCCLLPAFLLAEPFNTLRRCTAAVSSPSRGNAPSEERESEDTQTLSLTFTGNRRTARQKPALPDAKPFHPTAPCHVFLLALNASLAGSHPSDRAIPIGVSVPLRC